jgi:HEAT repeat protein
MAARILGRRRAVAAVPALISAAGDSSDPYLAAEAVRALVAIGTPDGLAAARRLASNGPVVVRVAAGKALAD